ncbi:MAG: ribonuclease HI [Elusimicrobia bacterium CG11_big_fil_rev_8_21_14_0_20_64_6]|nr:MAG: ribonuclease HI [Elusimicrobia bacterium CG11_big_fil_rev_8_21_14_0_20_64_6]
MISIFTDGACSGNPGPGGWAAIIATRDGRVLELGGREEPTTNNRMELGGVIAGLRAVKELPGVALIHSDSTYVIEGITKWILGWKRRGWKTAAGEPVKNEDLWRVLERLVSERGRSGVQWRWVKGHSGHDANERCDEIAVAFAKRQAVSLYDGPLLSYPHGSLLPSEAKALPARPKDRKAADNRPVSYISLLAGEIQRHATWPECEARVKGRPAKFKKVRSEAEAAETLKSWGVGEI